MIGSLSLRARVISGAIFWTVGLLTLASAALAYTVETHPGARYAVHSMLAGHMPAIISVTCLVVGFLQVRSGLSGMDQIRRQLHALHEGRDRRLEGAFPSEVQPLVDDLNALLDQRDEAIERALTKAGDLAHGLKTPLAILAQEGERTESAGHHEVAASILAQVERMRRQVDYDLAHARAMSGHASGERCVLRTSIDGLVRALERLHASRAIAIEVRVDPALSVRGLAADVEEMIGNLLDNACRFANARVMVAAIEQPGAILITVDDDGQGLAPAMREKVLQRGVRADEAEFGSGLGLAIVRNLAELYGGSVTLDQSPAGGVSARLVLPA